MPRQTKAEEFKKWISDVKFDVYELETDSFRTNVLVDQRLSMQELKEKYVKYNNVRLRCLGPISDVFLSGMIKPS